MDLQSHKTIINKNFLLLILTLSSPILLIAQDTIDVNLNIKHIVGGVSEFDRSKYLIFHEDLTGKEWESDDMKKSFLEDNDVYLGRNNGTIVWEYNNTKEDPNKAGWPDIDFMKTRAQLAIDNYAAETFAHQFEDRYTNMMVGGQEHMYPHGQETSRYGLIYEGHEATAEFYANYLKDFFGTGGSNGRPQPKMLEVINEPFVKAGSLGTTKEEIAKYHNVVAKRVKEMTPDIMVGGYTAAHPAFESNNFGHWNSNWKMFIDVAGENMDFFSFHLYDITLDGSLDGTKTKRAGANIEAIMDMINHYSVLKLGDVKPFSISEYGWFCKDYEGSYNYLIDWYNIRSFNNMMLQLLERQDQVINAIPFVLLKAIWAKPAGADYNNYQSRLLREIGELPGETPHGGYIYTDILKFYEFWSDVNGIRIDTKSTDFDILSDAYVDGNKVHLILSNLNSEDRNVDLKLFGSGSNTIQSLKVKHQYLDGERSTIEITDYTEGIDQIVLNSEATMIIEYNFDSAISINETSSEKDYYADKYLQTINASLAVNFNINNVDIANNGEAILRVGVGRAHDKELKPTLVINGNELRVPEDWRGYDQKNRDSFFGVLEIPVPYEYLQSNNKVSVRFGDAGGHITTMILKVYNQSTEIKRSGFNFNDGADVGIKDNPLNQMRVFPNPTEGNLNIDNPLNSKLSFSIVNLSGNQINQGQLFGSTNTLDISELNNGIYFIWFKDSKNLKAVKFIKQ